MKEIKTTDVFQNEELKKKKLFSATFQLIFQHPEKTLKKEEIENITNEINQEIKKQLNGELRKK